MCIKYKCSLYKNNSKYYNKFQNKIDLKVNVVTKNIPTLKWVFKYNNLLIHFSGT
jgi:hypothetical protein